jgi:uncharacterized protein (TIGR00369 family)
VEFSDLKALMRAPAFHQWLGVELTRIDDGEVEVRLPFRSEFLGEESGTNIHGGIIATLADITACFAMMSSVRHDVPSMDLHVDYVRMAPPGDLVAIGRTIKAGRTIGVADVEIRSSDGRMIAIARCKTVNNAPARETLTKTGGES